MFPVAPELVEALVEVGDLDRAHAVLNTLNRRAEDQAHPWGLVTARRCHAVIQLAARRYDQSAGDALDEASADFKRLGLAFDAARCDLSLGRAQRRLKQWGPARASLNRAVTDFEELGSPGGRSVRARNWHESADALPLHPGRSPRPSMTSSSWPRWA